jgi:hypothetical protein
VKRNILLCLVLLLTSCLTVDVDDFGPYWDKGYVDVALLGKWGEIDPNDKNVIHAEILAENGMYLFSDFDKSNESDDSKQDVGRTLKTGSYTYIMYGDKKALINGRLKKGFLWRYKIAENKIVLYGLNTDQMVKFLKKKFPDEKNLEKKPCNVKEEKCLFDGLHVKKLDEEILRILADIPDTKEFWTYEGEIPRHAESH